MILGVIFVALPVAIYVGVVALPRGRPALLGVLGAGAAIAALWLAYIFSVGPLFAGDRAADGYMVAATAIYTFAWALAALAQGLRLWLLPDAARRAVYAIGVIGLLIVFGVPTVALLGV